jgi:two-component system, sensor histidine kinase and response regulator
MYVNEELEYFLDYKKNELQGLNVSMLLPTIISLHHDRFIQRYLDTGKSRILNKRIVNFAINKAGYLVPIELLVKVYP